MSTKSGLVRIGLFFLLIASIAFMLDRAIVFGLHRINGSVFGVWNRIVEGRINADILVVGSSRALNHYNANSIAKHLGEVSTYNIGLNGSQIDMQLARLWTYLAHNKKPQLLIYNLDLFTFEISHGEVFDPGQYIPYLDQSHLLDALKEINPSIWKSSLIPLYGFAVEDLRFTWLKGLAAAGGWQPKEDHPLGFNPRYQTWTGDFETFKTANQLGVTAKIETKGLAALERLAQYCANQHINLLLVYSPEFKEMQKITKNRDAVFAQFQRISTAYGVQFWDYSDSSISSEKSNFYNSQHLNAAGAEEFSNQLASRIAAQRSLLSAAN